LYKELKEAEARLTLELFEAEHENLIGVQAERQEVERIEEKIDVLEKERLRVRCNFVTSLEGFFENKKEEMRQHRISRMGVSRKPAALKVAEKLADKMEN
jgi:hypothetical protein